MKPKFDVFWLNAKFVIVLPFASKKPDTYGTNTPASMVMLLPSLNFNVA